MQVPRIKESSVSKTLRKSQIRSKISDSQKSQFTSLGESVNKFKIDNIKLSLEIASLEQQIADFQRNNERPEQVQAENAKLRREVAELEKMLAGIRSANTQLVNQSQLTTTTQNIEVYSAPEILKLERDVQEMEGKNRRLREVLTSMGVTTTQAYDGAVTVVENREVEYQLQHERVALEQQSKQELEQ